jgi:hypothetical protein
MSLFEQRFSTETAADAAGMRASALQTWLRRKVVCGHETFPLEGGGSSGAYRSWSFRNVMEVAVVQTLVSAGIDLDRARPAGLTFAYTGSSIGTGVVSYGEAPTMREPGFPFYVPGEVVRTFGYVAKGRGAAVIGAPAGFDHAEAAMVALGRPSVWTRFDGNDIFFRVCERLGVIPLTALRDAYGHGSE